MPEEDKPKTEFEFKLVPFHHFSGLISQGLEKRIEPSALAQEIREHGIEKMPPDIVDYLCRYLSGEIETRGRIGLSPLDRKIMGRQHYQIYRHMYVAITGGKDAQSEAIKFLAENAGNIDGQASRSDRAWQLASIWCYGHSGHFRSLQNSASKAHSAEK